LNRYENFRLVRIAALIAFASFTLSGCLTNEPPNIASESAFIDPISNQAPEISGTPQTAIQANNVYSFTPAANDVDSDTLTFSVSRLPAWATFSGASGRINGTPGDADVGVYTNIQISVSDGNATADLAPFSITVSAMGTANSPPVISGTPPTSVNAGIAYSFTPTSSDVDNNVLMFSVSGLPAWATFDESSGGLSGTPTANDVGTYPNILISVTDGEFTATLPEYSITVSVSGAPNSPPVISGTPPTSINANNAYSFRPTASDVDNNTLTFSVSGLPVWASFGGATGRISGTPGDADVGVYTNIRISVSDGIASANLAPFSITVNAVATPNSPPVISGTPPTSINANNAYSFTPTASDVDNNTLTFSVSGLPVWANFSDVTGRISGTPGDADVGVYTNIQISVSDGNATADLAPFSITVNAISFGTATLNWTAPTQNEDGSPLLDLDKYRIYWGTGSGNYPNSVTIDAGTTTYVVENLAAGTYEFVATSISAAGVESAYSNPAVKTVF